MLIGSRLLRWSSLLERATCRSCSKVTAENRDLGIKLITLNNPSKRNALSFGVIDELITHIQGSRNDRCVIIQSTGDVFSAGHDLKELMESDTSGREGIFRRFNDLMLMIARHHVPIIASVDGLATAAGCQLVAACHIALCSDKSRFATPGVNIGLFCSTPGVQLSRSVNRKLAMDMLLTGEPIAAQAALRGGLVSRILPSEELEGETLRVAKLVAEKSKPVVKLGIQNFNRQVRSSLEEAAYMSAGTMIENLDMSDGKEGIHAFIEKRPPNWD